MNSASKQNKRVWQSVLMAGAVSLMLCSGASAQVAAPVAPQPQAAPAPVAVNPQPEVPAPAPVPAAPAVAEVPDPSAHPLSDADAVNDFVGEGPDAAGATTSVDTLIQDLRSGNGGKALTIAQLAAINDALKRMEYKSQIEKKMNDLSGAASSATAGRAANTPVMQAPSFAPQYGGMDSQNATPTVLRVIGTGGVYQAVILANGKQTTVLVGDDTPLGRVTKISLSGVTVSKDGAQQVILFAAPLSLSGFSSY